MRSTYSNTKHPKLVKWSSVIALVLSIVCFSLYIMLDNDQLIRFLLYFGAACFYILPFNAANYYLTRFIVDEDAGTITDSRVKKYPMKISQLSTISYKESKAGKFRSLLIHDSGVGFMDIRTSKENADRITEQLTRLNPSIVVKHENYI